MNSQIASKVIVGIGVALTLFSACVERKPEMISKKDSPVTTDLSAMVKEHEMMATDNRTSSEVFSANCLRYRQQVYQYLSQSLLIEPGDLYRAALLLMTADSTGKENYMLAYYLAMESAKKGHAEARYLSAFSLDKYLAASGLRQKYGTQFARDRFGRTYMLPFDTTTTDADRAAWDVPAIDSLVRLVEARNKAASPQPKTK